MWVQDTPHTGAVPDTEEAHRAAVYPDIHMPGIRARYTSIIHIMCAYRIQEDADKTSDMTSTHERTADINT